MEELELITHAEHEKALRERISPHPRRMVNPINSWAVDAIIPEPSTYALFGIGAIGMLMVMRRKKVA